MTFYLGTHETSWLKRSEAPMFISRRRLARLVSLPVAKGEWCLDSGGFTELNASGGWSISARDYADEARRYRDEIGGMRWAAIQDWMCEPFVLAKTGKTVAEHQHLSTISLVELRSIAPDMPWCPVLQGWGIDDYFEHVELYRVAGFDLTQEPIVGVGSVCRRQGTKEAGEIFGGLAAIGLKLHGFGLKIQGLKRFSHLLASADSMAWSFRARRSDPLPGCTHSSCANCIKFAISWRSEVLAAIARPQQRAFNFGGSHS